MRLVDRFDSREHFFGELQLGTGQVAIQLRQAGGADDVAGHEGLRGDEGQGHLRRVQAVLAGQSHVT